MITKLIAGSVLALGVALSPLSVQTAAAHPPGPAQCWVWKHHHWKWVCKRRHVAPIYDPYIYDPYVYDPYLYQPFYYPYPTFGIFFGGGGHHHHHKNWDWKKH
jgi:hypothetical protein